MGIWIINYFRVDIPSYLIHSLSASFENESSSQISFSLNSASILLNSGFHCMFC